MKQQIFFVDNEPNIRRVVRRTLEKLNAEVSCFAGARACLTKLTRQKKCDLLITDVKMPGMDGVELLARTRCVAPWLPVLLITGYGDVQMAVRAMKTGAVDFIEKPLDRESFLGKVESILKQNAFNDPALGKPLTATERKVLTLIIDGKSNREIAELFGRSVRTIEDHRSHIMRKLGARNKVELVERAIAMKLVKLPASQKRKKSNQKLKKGKKLKKSKKRKKSQKRKKGNQKHPKSG